MRTQGCLVLLALSAVLTACTPTTPKPDGSPSQTPNPSPQTSSTALASGVSVRECRDSTNISVGSDASSAAGPVRLAPLDYRFGDVEAFAKRESDADGWHWFKIPVIIERGTQAEVSIPVEFRDVALLTYNATGSRPTTHTTTFVACPLLPGDTAATSFAGGFVVRGAMCLPVDVKWAGQSKRLTLNFGKPSC